jgi:hypothetical protein
MSFARPGIASREFPLRDQREVWQMAILLLRKLGTEALPTAHKRARKAAETGDDIELRIWGAVETAVEELLRSPEADDWRH